ncbi:MAG: 3-dehydroquinate synthase [Deltaproteobacteria bacterium]|nr:3-dehydroquinate synthase [Deltaproteobacteria bacterium]
MNRIRLNLEKRSSNSYDICIGTDLPDRMGLIMAKNNWASRYVIVTDDRVGALYGESMLGILRGLSLVVDRIDIPAGEKSKRIETCIGIAERLIDLGADRTSALIALGGGVVGDITGFVASMFMRGIPYIQMPTTLVAQIDSAIGGKTGIDLEGGKNLLGAFHQPKAVFIDLAFLKTLDDREFSNGLAEIVKYGLIEDPSLLDLLETEGQALRKRDPALLEKIVLRACQIKKGIVEIDDTEKGLRRVLNFGHTLGHAVEAASGYGLSHGEAVAIGMAASLRLSEKMGYLKSGDRERIDTLIESLGLPRRMPAALDPDDLLRRIGRDKKKTGDRVPFVLIRKPGMPFMNGGVPEAMLRDTMGELRG